MVYTSGTGGLIKSGVPIGKISQFDPKSDQDIIIEFFSDFRSKVFLT